MKPDERAFEEHIADSLVESGGYRAVKVGNPSDDFDAERGLDMAELFAFVETTQAGEWGRLSKLHGGEARARERFADRLAQEARRSEAPWTCCGMGWWTWASRSGWPSSSLRTG